MRYFSLQFFNKISLLALILGLFISLSAGPAWAGTGPGGEDPLPTGSGGASNAGVDLFSYLVLKNGKPVSEVFKTPADMVNLLVSNAFIVAGLFFFVLVIVAGFKLLSDESKGLQEAQTLLIQAGIGFVVMFAAYWIVQVIQIVTGVRILF